MSPRFPLSDHCDGHRFFNPDGASPPALGAIMQWQLARLFRKKSGKVETSPGASVRPSETSPWAATFLGHASFLLRGPRWSALLDPVCSKVAGPGFRLGVPRLQPPALKVDDLPTPDLVLLTHNHYDHCDAATLRNLARRSPRPVAVCPLGLRKLLVSFGFRDVVELDWWESHEFADGPKVTLTPARHFSARGPFDRNRSLWGGFYLEDGSVRVLAAGDTGYATHFAEIAERLGPPELSLLPIGAYLPAALMRPIHQNPAEALQAHRDLRSRRSVAFHFGAFPLADDGLHEPARDLAELLLREGLDPETFVIPNPGCVVAVPTRFKN